MVGSFAVAKCGTPASSRCGLARNSGSVRASCHTEAEPVHAGIDLQVVAPAPMGHGRGIERAAGAGVEIVGVNACQTPARSLTPSARRSSLCMTPASRDPSSMSAHASIFAPACRAPDHRAAPARRRWPSRRSPGRPKGTGLRQTVDDRHLFFEIGDRRKLDCSAARSTCATVDRITGTSCPDRRSVTPG